MKPIFRNKLINQSKDAAEQRKGEGAKEGDNQEGSDEEDDEEELKRIEGISEPKYRIVYSYPINVEDCWEPPADILKDRKFPISLRVSIQTPFIESIKGADLDINEDTLMFKVQDIYDLMLTFKYKVDPDKGNAKFEKDKKTLVIDLPVVGVTESTHESMKKEKEQFERNMKRISGGLVQDMDNYTENVSKEFNTEIDLEQKVDLDKLKEEALAGDEKEENSQNFLKVYDESKNSLSEKSEGPTVLDEVKFKEEENTTEGIIGINPLNSEVQLVKEITSEDEKSPEELKQIKQELGIPEKVKEKEFE